MNSLKSNWNELTGRYTSNDVLVDELWKELDKRYSTAERYYHNLNHLQYMITHAACYSDAIEDMDALLFSIFYHDVIYNVHHQDNEQKSAEFAIGRLKRLGIDEERLQKCQQQIMATQMHSPSEDKDTNYLIDFDLAILGEKPEHYQEYIRNIRMEYAIYPDFLYSKGRRKVLQHFLAMDAIYKTVEFRDEFEQQAKANLKAELEAL